ncbi:hypothetical protein MRX96_002327 [Rhipicephalus microplus]
MSRAKGGAILPLQPVAPPHRLTSRAFPSPFGTTRAASFKRSCTCGPALPAAERRNLVALGTQAPWLRSIGDATRRCRLQGCGVRSVFEAEKRRATIDEGRSMVGRTHFEVLKGLAVTLVLTAAAAATLAAPLVLASDLPAEAHSISEPKSWVLIWAHRDIDGFGQRSRRREHGSVNLHAQPLSDPLCSAFFTGG